MVKSGKTYHFLNGFFSKTNTVTPIFYFRNEISTYKSTIYQKIRKINRGNLSVLSHLNKLLNGLAPHKEVDSAKMQVGRCA